MAIHDWQGLARNMTANDVGGALYASNVRFWVDGELQRRNPFQRAITQNANGGMQLFIGPNGIAYVVSADASGNIIVGSA
jgi:hypothetical protein